MWLIRILLYCVSCFILVADIHTESTLHFNKTSRIKLQDEPWIWGEVPPKNNSGLESKLTTSTVEPTSESSLNPCDLLHPPKPDFRAPGRRISEAKCLEYIWEREDRENLLDREHQCYLYQMSGEGLTSLGKWMRFPREFPHMGGVGWRAVGGTWAFKCGASLISSKFMLTAAHCSKASPLDTNITNLDPEIVRFEDEIRVQNVSDIDIKSTDAKILRIIVHPNYKAPGRYFDLAVIELVEEIQFSNMVQPACLWNNFDTSKLGPSVKLTGWGVTETGLTSSILLYTDVDIIDSELCDTLLKHRHSRLWCGVQDHQICAGKLAGGTDTCQGDSGGPLQVEIPLQYELQGSMYYLIGITSFGFGCARPNMPSVYVRVSSFVDWIESVVWP